MTADTTLDLLDNDPVFHLKGGMLTMTLVELIRLAPDQFARQLAEKVEQAPNFFVDTPVVIALDKLNEPLTDLTLRHLLNLCRDHGLQPVALRGGEAFQRSVGLTAHDRQRAASEARGRAAAKRTAATRPTSCAGAAAAAD